MKTLLILVFLTLSGGRLWAADPMASFDPTNIYSQDTLSKAFKKLYRGKTGSECYDRAHFWSFQMAQEFDINSTKVFVFFTNKYKREINNQWWFHVAPGVVYRGTDYMMDPEFLNKPVSFEAWKNGVLDHAINKLTPIKIQYEKDITKLYKEISSNANLTQREQRRITYVKNRIEYLEDQLDKMLISNVEMVEATSKNWPYKNPQNKKFANINCKEIAEYSEYVENQETEYCYIIRTSMHYRAPRDVENLEKQGKYIYEFDNWNVTNAYQKAFGGRFPYRL